MRYGSTDLLAETRCLFAPIPCTGGSPEPEDVRSYLDEHHEQLWTEAVKRVRALHETAYLPDSLKGAQSKLTDQYRAVDEVAEEVIGAWLDNNPGAVTAYKIASGINWTPDSRSVYRITTVLKQMGYTRLEKRVRSSVGRTWAWTPPGPAQPKLSDV